MTTERCATCTLKLNDARRCKFYALSYEAVKNKGASVLLCITSENDDVFVLNCSNYTTPERDNLHSKRNL